MTFELFLMDGILTVIEIPRPTFDSTISTHDSNASILQSADNN